MMSTTSISQNTSKLDLRKIGTDQFPLRQSHISKIAGSFACSRALFLEIKEKNTGILLKKCRFPKTVRGSVVHRCIEYGHSSKRLDLLPFFYLQEWRREENRTDEPRINWKFDDRQQVLIEGFKMLAGYFKDHRNLNANVIAQEITFKVKIAGKYICSGTVDQIRKTPIGYELIDFKTGEIPQQEELNWSPQLCLYSLAMLEGEFFYKDRPDEKIYFNEFPAKIGLVKLNDYIPYEKATPKTISYHSEAVYYQTHLGAKILPTTSKNSNGHPLLAVGLPRGCGFYWSNFDLDFLPLFEKSLANAISTIRMNRYWFANSTMACSRCAYRGEVCREITTESGKELAELKFKSIRRRNNGTEQFCH